MPSLINSGPDYSPIIAVGKQAEHVGRTEADAAQHGGTPFQKASVAAYKKTAAANWTAYEKEFGAAGGGAGGFGALDTGSLTEEDARVLGEHFIQSDFTVGLEALGLAGKSYNLAAGISAQQSAQMTQAAGSLVSVLGAIFA